MFAHVTNEKYFTALMRNMIAYRCATGDDQQFTRVRAGTTGNGTAPHYQFETCEGTQKKAYSGLNHRPIPFEQFNPDNLTDRYSYADMEGFLGKIRGIVQ